MSDDGVDLKKRRFLTATTSAVGLAGMGAAVVALVQYMGKSERAEQAGAPVEFDTSKLLPGKLVKVEWRSQPVWIFNRTPEMLTDLKVLDKKLKDPQSKNSGQQPMYAQNDLRAIADPKKKPQDKPNILVVIGLCTHLGCAPKQIEKTAVHELGTEWLGGFLCACHGSKFDYSGRVYQNVPAPDNLKIPKHYYKGPDNSLLVIGLDASSSKGGES